METVSTYAVVPFISGLFNVLLDRLAPENMREYLIRSDSTTTELSKLRTSMMIVRRAINDAEEKQDSDPDVKSWFKEVKHAVYDAEDLLDEIHTEVAQRRVESETPSSKHHSSQVLNSITATFSRYVVALDPFHEGIDSKVRQMNHRFEGFSQLIKVLNLRFSVEKSWGSSSSRLTSSFVDESIIYGRDSEKELMVGLLQDGMPSADDHGSLIKGRKFLEGNIRTLAIIGMPGMGKTTLAQLVFNDPRVDHIFEYKSWICVPNVSDITQIIRSLLNLLLESNQYMAEAELERSRPTLRNKVSGRRILIVLDDVWDENFDAVWKSLLASLKSAAPGSTIIVTTRNEDIAKLFHPFYILPLHELSHEDCWALLKLHAFGYHDAAPEMKVEVRGREILANCGGLPLAVKALGGLLRYSLDAKDWEIIANSKIWDLPSCKKEILPALLLSYNYLPAHLKRCFSYCSIFPKSYNFDKEKLVLQWMAGGFIQKGRNDSKQMEDIGNIYFHDLLARCFFQQSTSKKNCFVMHDLIHDLAVYVMEEFSFMLEPNISHVSIGMLRHFSFIKSKYETMEKFGATACTSSLRTFLPVGSFFSPSSCYLSNNLLHSLQLFGRLRLLSLSGYRITSLPSSIGRLKHLRYLDFSSTFIEELPESICGLFNLQTLLLSHCEQLRMLPTMMRNLLQLRHLNIQGTCIDEMPEHIGKLSCLQTLTDFVASESHGAAVRELGELSQLRGSLTISGLENVLLEADAFAANLKGKVHLDEIILLQREVCSVSDRQHERIIHALKPNTNLRRLTIDYYEGEKFPSWLGDEAFCNLEVLHLKQCPSCVELPSLGNLPLLKHLLIKDFDELETLGAEFYGQLSAASSPFKSLITLKLEGLQQFKKWSAYEGNAGPFPCLQELHVLDCRELEGDFPLELPSLVVLNIKDCQKLCGSLSNAPSLRVLDLAEVGQLDVSNLAHFTCLTNLFLQWGKQFPNDSIKNAREAIQHLSSLGTLKIEGNGTISLHPWHVPSSVRAMSIFSDEVIEINGLSQLQYLHVHKISSPLRFPAGHFQLIHQLSIVKCDGLAEFPIILERDELGFSSIMDLTFEKCHQFNTFPAGGFPALYLSTLYFFKCDKLTSPPDRMSDNFPSLRFLGFQYCPQLDSIPEDGLPLLLLTLRINDCHKFRTLPEALSRCASLELFDIENCPELASFPESGLPPNLHKLRLYNCKIRSLPDRMGSTLKILDIWKCYKLESFPQSGLPPRLEFMQIYGCEKLVSKYADWQLGNLSCLKELSIGGFREIESFPADGSLPTSLNILKIDQFFKLRSINCGELQRIGSLREFEFHRCPSLLLFSGDLPQSLCRLTIKQSPLMEKRCVGPDGYYVDKISHITCLELDA